MSTAIAEKVGLKPLVEPIKPVGFATTRPEHEIAAFLLEEVRAVAEPWITEEPITLTDGWHEVDGHRAHNVVEATFDEHAKERPLRLLSRLGEFGHTIYEEGAPLPNLNVELLRIAVGLAVMESDMESYVNQYGEPVEWEQGTWARGKTTDITITDARVKDDTYQVVCNTSCCIAGWATNSVGAPMVIETYGEEYEAGEIVHADYALDPVSGEVDFVPTIAREYLGLTYIEGDHLFDGENDVNTVVRTARLAAFVRGIDPDLIAQRRTAD